MLSGLSGKARNLWTLCRMATRVSPLGAGPLGKARAFLAVLWLDWRARLPGRRRSGRPLHLPLELGGTRYDVAIGDRTELGTLGHIFHGGEYGGPDRLGEVRSVIDAGANVGGFTLWVTSRFRNCRVVAVEPDPEVFARLAANVAHLPRVRPVRAAVADHVGTAQLARSRATVGSRLVPDGADDDVVEVPTLTLDRLFDVADGPVDLLKLDIEGAEWSVFDQMPDLTGVRHLFCEVHGEPRPGARRALVADLRTRGFACTWLPNNVLHARRPHI